MCHTSPQAVGAAKDMIRGYGGNTPDVIVEALEVEGLAKVSSTTPALGGGGAHYIVPFQAIDGALKEIRKLAPNSAAMMFSVDHENGGVLCHSTVPKVQQQGGRPCKRGGYLLWGS